MPRNLPRNSKHSKGGAEGQCRRQQVCARLSPPSSCPPVLPPPAACSLCRGTPAPHAMCSDPAASIQVRQHRQLLCVCLRLDKRVKGQHHVVAPRGIIRPCPPSSVLLSMQILDGPLRLDVGGTRPLRPLPPPPPPAPASQPRSPFSHHLQHTPTHRCVGTSVCGHRGSVPFIDVGGTRPLLPPPLAPAPAPASASAPAPAPAPASQPASQAPPGPPVRPR